MIRVIFTFLIGFCLVGFVVHKYYVTIVELNHNTSTKKIEISIKFIGHDLEYVLSKEGSTNLFLGTQKEVYNADSILDSYINSHFSVLVNESKQKLSFFGKEIKPNDDIYCYLESSPIQKITSIELQSDLLNEYFNDHVTIVYMKIGEERFNFRLNKEKQQEKHLIKN